MRSSFDGAFHAFDWVKQVARLELPLVPAIHLVKRIAAEGAAVTVVGGTFDRSGFNDVGEGLQHVFASCTQLQSCRR